MSNDLIDMGGYPEIYADGLGDVEVVGSNARLVLFNWRRIDGVFRRQTCATVIRPVASLSCDFSTYSSLSRCLRRRPRSRSTNHPIASAASRDVMITPMLTST
jgi:hypothetical protein